MYSKYFLPHAGKPEVSEITDTAATVIWTEPISDGGSWITSYVLEKYDKKTDKWVRTKKTDGKTLSHRVDDLIANHEYKFRVTAENKAGTGLPSEESDSFIAKLPFGKILFLINCVFMANLIFSLFLHHCCFFLNYYLHKNGCIC